jgi:membrane associated rhomboid family serine protease
MPPVTKNLIIINVIVWVAMMVFPSYDTEKVIAFGGLHYWGGSSFNVAQLFTYMFMHDTRSIAHLFFNMFTLFMFGITLERVLGSARFLFYYLTCGIGAALIQEFTWMLTAHDFAVKLLANLYSVGLDDMEQALAQVDMGFSVGSVADALQQVYNQCFVTIGASGAIYGVLLAFGMLFPNLPLYIMFIPIPIKAKWMVIGYGVIELVLGLSAASDGVAHFAHLGGMIFGLLLILYWKHQGIIRRNGIY